MITASGSMVGMAGYGHAVCGGLYRGEGKTQHEANHGCWELDEAFYCAETLFQTAEPPVNVENFESDWLGQLSQPNNNLT